MNWSARARNDIQDELRVRVFVDHWEFALSWQIAHSGIIGRHLTDNDIKNAQFESQSIRWDLLPEAIIDQLDDLDYIEDAPKELRLIDVYASKSPKNDDIRRQFEEWLENTLDPLPGFQVHHFIRKSDDKMKECKTCSSKLDKPELEKGLKTKIACDMLSLAVKDVYDIGVLIADDAELHPSILSVQEIFDKKIIHVGAKGKGQALRSAAWGHFLLDDLMRDMISSDDFKRRKKTART